MGCVTFQVRCLPLARSKRTGVNPAVNRAEQCRGAVLVKAILVELQ